MLGAVQSASPVAVFAWGCLLGTEVYSPYKLTSLMVISIGVLLASYGEVNFDWIGVAVQLTSIAIESLRLNLVQTLLQMRGLTLNPVTTMCAFTAT